MFADVGGWDTHVNQGGATGQLALRLSDFAQSIAALVTDLGPRMSDVVLMSMTEFGRTTRQNGNGGTDHGHAGAMFLLGGSVKGGKVHGKWPGLEREQLFEGRDLALTTDFRSVLQKSWPRTSAASNWTESFRGLPLDAWTGSACFSVRHLPAARPSDRPGYSIAREPQWRSAPRGAATRLPGKLSRRP